MRAAESLTRTVLIALCPLLGALPLLATELDETARERLLAELREESARASGIESSRFDAGVGSLIESSQGAEDERLFVGVDDVTVPKRIVDPSDGAAVLAFEGFEVWGAAAVPQVGGGIAVFFSSGTEIYRWIEGSAPELFCTLIDTSTGNPMTGVGLGWNTVTSRLLVSRTVAPEGIYSSPSCAMTLTIPIDGTIADIGGLTFDPTSGKIYGTNDDADLRGIVEITPGGALNLVAPYPSGETDVDGLAYTNGRLYLVTDDNTPAEIYVYDLAGGTYLPSIPSPWTSSEVFSGATAGFFSIIFADGFNSGTLAEWSLTEP